MLAMVLHRLLTADTITTVKKSPSPQTVKARKDTAYNCEFGPAKVMLRSRFG